jgi:hypothetical protein
VLDVPVQACRRRTQANPGPHSTLRCEDDARKGNKVVDSKLPGKASYLISEVIVPQTDTRRQEEYSKALERTLVKELGKIAP